MSNFQSEIQKLVDGFVTQLAELWRRAAIDSLTGLDAGMGRGKGRVMAMPGAAGRGRGRGAKRTGDELDQLADSFVEYVRANPGLRIEQINKQLGTSTKELALPIRKLLADGVLKAKGKKRSTAYFAGEGSRRKKATKA
ncbi:MAG: DNA-binding protein [Deltaproteobacteria bacterium]|nr:DNA-binding protein [Deltaproteobacteria bacterium]